MKPGTLTFSILFTMVLPFEKLSKMCDAKAVSLHTHTTASYRIAKDPLNRVCDYGWVQ